MTGPRPSTVVIGQVVVAATADGVETAEAVGIADGRVVVVGRADEVLAAAARGARTFDAGSAAAVPGLHDFHLHLVGMARARRDVALDGASDFAEVLSRVRAAAEQAADAEWLRGGGWSEAIMRTGEQGQLTAASAGRAALFYSHDGHSAWASPLALAAAGISATTPDPPGGRLERDGTGSPTGILRERAADLVELAAGRLSGAPLEAALDEVLAELAALGVTGATDAGDTTAQNGVGEHAFLGDRASRLMAASRRLDGRLRLTLNLPAEAIDAAAARGWRTGMPLPGQDTLRLGWAKAYVDGALGSRTAAVFVPYDGTTDRGILRLEPSALAEIVKRGRAAGIGLAVHAIGDRAVASTLDAFAGATGRAANAPPDRLEHLQLVRGADIARLAALEVTASMQPLHAASDRRLVDSLWSASTSIAYPWRSIATAGGRLAFGSDAPIESANPWLGLFAAVHRRFPDDAASDWRPEEALTPAQALAAYTTAPARAMGRADEGHLRAGAVADLAVLNVDLATLLAADERLVDVRAELTLVGGREVHRS
jgi:predicted amidohydrolase YtcJ